MSQHQSVSVSQPLSGVVESVPVFGAGPLGECVHRLFEHQVERRPHAKAVSYENESLTYSELNHRANQLAHDLRRRGVGPDVLVAVCMDRSLDVVVALLAVLKAGGAYVPLDPAYPKDRISYILADAGCRILITNRESVEHIPSAAAELVLLDHFGSAFGNNTGENLGKISGPQNLAYVIYTSGSTGKPKGVEIEHRNVVNFLRSMQKEPGLTENDVLAAVTTFCFDISGLEIYLPLVTGAQIVMMGRDEVSDGKKLQQRMQRTAVTVLQATPATWRLLLEADWPGNKKLKALCGGEAFPRELANTLVTRCGSLWNMYGPTETTIWSTVYEVTEQGETTVPIGHAIDNTRLYIVDEQMNLVPSGDVGQLLIGGEGVARGYRGRPELTGEKFMPDPFSPEDGQRVYKTGDLARVLSDGNVSFLGRMDHQVKIRGYRIELGEIEAVLATHRSIKQCVVAAREDSPGDKRLVAYMLASGDQKPVARVLREHLQTKLPDYMVPTAFVVLDSMPLTPNGKVDRKALPAPDRKNAALDHEYVPARTSLEKKLVQIWESMLGVTPIGITDNIFELGVDSVIAARLFARIEKTLGRDLPPAPLFRAPTVEMLAKLLESQDATPRKWTSLVAVQPEGEKTPLFCVHGAAGTVLFFQPLASRIAPHRPLFAFQSQGLYGRDLPHTSVEEMAAHYISEMRTVQPHGPYLLAGWCFGGVVAFEMAQQLTRVGERVEMLAMFNAPSAPQYDVLPGDIVPIADRAAARWREFQTLGMGEKLVFVTRKFKEQLLWRGTDLYNRWVKFSYKRTLPIRRRVYDYYLNRRRPLPDFMRNRFFRFINARAERRYEHQQYPGSIVVFRDQLPYPDSAQGWGRFCGDIAVREIPVSVQHHRALLQEPAVALLAEQIEQYLTQRASVPAAAV